MELCAEFICPRADETEPETGIRVTVGEASMRDMHLSRRLTAEAWAWFWQATRAHWAGAADSAGGAPEDTKAALLTVPDDDPAWQMLTAGQERAYMLACLRKVEHRAAETWYAGELPPAWGTLEGFANGCPALLAAAWANAARRCNPGLFEPEHGDPKARSGGARVKKPGSA